LEIIVGTAGHIDHGKTALVRALTGVDADRLPEEKKRGITIDLGFAELDLGEIKIGFVDVPGHERFVKNMLAGAHGIDLVALVVAADEGVMPQTREHFDICRMLETRAGLVALTKCDLADEETQELARLDIAELVAGSFLENAPVIAVSAKTGAGIDALKETLKALAAKIPVRKNETVARLPIDRSFTMKGFGAVVTGTLVSGEVSESDELELLPIGKKGRVRGLQTHGKSVKTAHAGQRAAINLGGIEHHEIERGMLLTVPNALKPTQVFDAQVEVLSDAPRPLKTRQRLRVHCGAAEVLGRLQVIDQTGEIAPGARGLAQFRLESPVVVLPGERFIIRSYSPQRAIAGGKVIDNLAARHRKRDTETAAAALKAWLEAENAGDNAGQLAVYLGLAGEKGLRFCDLQARAGWRSVMLQNALSTIVEHRTAVKSGEVYFAAAAFEKLKAAVVAAVEAHHQSEPLSRGLLRETLREKIFAHLPPEAFSGALATLAAEGKIGAEKDVIRAASFSLDLSPQDKALKDKLYALYRAAKLEPPTLEQALNTVAQETKQPPAQARKIFQLLLNSGEIKKISEEFCFSADSINSLIAQMKAYADATSGRLIDMTAFKDMAGVSRKYAIPLLEYFDREKITRRAGDKRLIL
jgi:selenocysteine-specific elongation factor